jgi:hypothetical protein
VKDLVRKPEYNGKAGKVVSAKNKKGMIRVAIDNKKFDLKPENLERKGESNQHGGKVLVQAPIATASHGDEATQAVDLTKIQIGDQLELFGLSKHSDFNGREVTLMSTELVAGEVRVYLDGKEFTIKPQNLRKPTEPNQKNLAALTGSEPDIPTDSELKALDRSKMEDMLREALVRNALYQARNKARAVQRTYKPPQQLIERTKIAVMPTRRPQEKGTTAGFSRKTGDNNHEVKEEGAKFNWRKGNKGYNFDKVMMEESASNLKDELTEGLSAERKNALISLGNALVPHFKPIVNMLPGMNNDD